ncbi:MAG: TadE/TadG family type IV pilus assembly protein [Limimaricola soesokkakensis]|uniref:TadE/TadG family type IV pilus assembly protein n=1 Tax=Limimaricola soesokkakensis TaxID=1343159 RepID=UPI0040587942
MNKWFGVTALRFMLQADSCLGCNWRKPCCLIRAEDGVSAIEFALLAPVLVVALLGTVDLGLALNERMAIDHVLRAGAQSATAGNDLATIDRVLRNTAKQNFTLAEPDTAGNDTALALTISRLCTCPEQPKMAVTCSATCTGSAPTQIFYAFAGKKTYSGNLLPRFTLSSALRVQVR